MEARNRIWEELKQAKTNIVCIQKYTDTRRKWNRYYSAFVGILSGIGALGYSINEMIPVFTSIIIGIVSVTKSVIPNLMQTEPELSKLDELYSFYARYLNNLEKIWYDLSTGTKNDDESINLFFKLKESECDNEVKMNKYLRSISKKMQNKVDKEVTKYANRIYLKNYDQ